MLSHPGLARSDLGCAAFPWIEADPPRGGKLQSGCLVLQSGASASQPHTHTCIRMKAPPCSWSTTFFLVSAACCLSGRMSPKGCGAELGKGAAAPWRVLGATSPAVAKLLLGACMCGLCVMLVCRALSTMTVLLRGRGKCLKSSTCLQRLPLPVGMLMRCPILQTSAPMCWVKGCTVQSFLSDSLPAAFLAVHPAWCRDHGRLHPAV